MQQREAAQIPGYSARRSGAKKFHERRCTAAQLTVIRVVMGGAAIISSPQRHAPKSFDAAAAETRFAHVAGGKRIPYSDVDNALILRALQRQADVVRLTPVMLPNGTVLEHEVRFGAHAVSDRVKKPPATGMILC